MFRTLLCLCLVAVLTVSGQESDDKCYGLALSNANSMGAYQAGVISGLIMNSPSDQVAYQVVSGVTEGALNAMILSQFESGEEKEASAALKTFWLETVAGKQLYEQYTMGAVEGFVLHDSLFKGQPLYDLIEEEFSQAELKRNMNIGIANVNNGSFVSFNEKFQPQNLVKALQASVSTPGVLEPVEAWDDLWFSGDVIWEIDVIAPIVRCLYLGYEEKDIVIDAIVGDNKVLEEVDVSKYNAFHMAQRTHELMNFYAHREGLLKAERAYPEVTFRHTIGRSSNWYDFKFVPMSQSEKEAKTLFQLGQLDAMDSLQELKENNFIANKDYFTAY